MEDFKLSRSGKVKKIHLRRSSDFNMRVFNTHNSESSVSELSFAKSQDLLVSNHKPYSQYESNSIGSDSSESQIIQTEEIWNPKKIENYRNKLWNESNNFPGKTSFCIDVLLHQASNTNAEDLNKSNRKEILFYTKMDITDLNSAEIDKKIPDSKNGVVVSDDTESRIDGQYSIPCSQIRGKTLKLNYSDYLNDVGKDLVYSSPQNKEQSCLKNSKMENKHILVTTDFEVNRTISASPDSIDSRSLTDSPPLSLGSEDQACMLLSSERSIKSTNDVNKGIDFKNNQNSISNSKQSLDYSRNIFNHSSRESAFYAIHKDRQYEKNFESVTFQPQQHLHSLHLEWLTHSGIIYPRFSTDFSGKIDSNQLLQDHI